MVTGARRRVQKWNKKVDPSTVGSRVSSLSSMMKKQASVKFAGIVRVENDVKRILQAHGVSGIMFPSYLDFARELFKDASMMSGATKQAEGLLASNKWQARNLDRDILNEIAAVLGVAPAPPPPVPVGEWLQTTQADFLAGVLTDVDALISPGDVLLAKLGTDWFDGFEAYAPGSFIPGQGGWTGDHADASQASNARAYAGDNSMKFTRNGSSSYHSFGATRKGRIILYFWSEQTGSTGETNYLWEDGTVCIGWAPRWDGTTFKIRTDAGWITVFTYTPGAWHQVKIEWYTNNTFSIWYDGTPAAGNPYNMDSPMVGSGINKVSLRGDYIGVYRDFIDNVQVLYDYYGLGTIASQVYNSLVPGNRYTELSWMETIDPGITDIRFKMRASDVPFTKDAAVPAWTDYGVADSPIVPTNLGQYVQWLASLLTSDVTKTPQLHSVLVKWGS